MGDFECICGQTYTRFMWYEAHVENCRAYQGAYNDSKHSKAQQLNELSKYGTSIRGPKGILHGCATCGKGFETPVEMGIHMLTECESGPKMSREELLGAAAPTDTEINEALASIADAAKETS